MGEATSLVEIGEGAFVGASDLAGTLMIPSTVTKIGPNAFYYTKLARLDLSKAISLVEIGEGAFSDTDLAGLLKVGPAVKTIGTSAFASTKLTSLDLSVLGGDLAR